MQVFKINVMFVVIAIASISIYQALFYCTFVFTDNVTAPNPSQVCTCPKKDSSFILLFSGIVK